MNEVSCKVTLELFKELRRTGVSVDEIVADLPYGIDHLNNKHERIDWEAFLLMIERLKRHWRPEDFVRFGAIFVRAPVTRPFVIIARLMFTVRELYLWVAKSTTGGGAQMFTCVLPGGARDLAPDRLEIVARMQPGYRFMEEYFMMTKGGFEELPRILGFRPAVVQMFPT